MPFGLANAFATFQGIMEPCMGYLYLTDCAVYIDDVIAYSSSYDENLIRLKAIFKDTEVGLKLETSKCTFFQKKFLGHTNCLRNDFT